MPRFTTDQSIAVHSANLAKIATEIAKLHKDYEVTLRKLQQYQARKDRLSAWRDSL